MTAAFAKLLILAVLAADGSQAPGTADVFACDFGATWDANFDRWPDGWTRATGPNFPKYVQVAITSDESSDARSLRVDLDGGAAAAFSPEQAASSEFSYRLEVTVRTAQLRRNRAWASLAFLDAEKQPLQTLDSRRLNETTEWTTLSIGPIACEQSTARHAVIGLHVEPEGRSDVHGSAEFRDVRLVRFPRLEVTSESLQQVYTSPTDVQLACRVSGFEPQEATLEFELTDALGRNVERFSRPLGPSAETPNQSSKLREHQSTWRPRLADFGYYRATVSLQERGRTIVQRSLSLAVVVPGRNKLQSEFGWTLGATPPLAVAPLAELIGQAGIGWVKLPLWYQEADPALEDLVWFTEKMNVEGIRTVGLLDRPPNEIRGELSSVEGASAAEIFSADPKLWYPSLEGMLGRLALRVRWWQLGGDKDTSFVGDSRLAEKIADIRQRLDHLGQGAGLGFGWNWLQELPQGVTGSFLSISAEPPLTHQELSAYLTSVGSQGMARWVVIEPLPRGEYSTMSRAVDLVWQMIAAKMAGAEGIFLSQPFSTDHGVMGEDGSPGELFIPWRTAALALAGAEYLGQLELAGGSENYVFARDGQAVLVVWADTPRQEKLFLGEDVSVTDLWGHNTPLPQTDGQHTLDVTSQPTFVVGVNEAIARWRLALKIENRQLTNQVGSSQSTQLTVRNFFPQGVSGTLRIVAPEHWQVQPDHWVFKLATDEEQTQPLQLTLPFDTSSGIQPLNIEFDLTADRRYQFSVFRPFTVGVGDIEIETSTRLTDTGELEIEQRFINRTNELVSFRCALYVKNRPRVRSSVLELPQGEDVRTYRLRNGRDLIDQDLFLQAEEIGGSRVLNYRLIAKP